MKHRIPFVLLIAALAGAPAFGTSVGVFGLMNLGSASSVTRVTVPPPAPFTGKTGFGGGLFFRGDSNPFVNFELNAILVQRRLDGGAAGDVTFPTLEIPLFLRFTLPILSLGVGAYYAARISDATSSSGANPGKFNTHDFGLAAALGAEIPLGAIALFGEARYIFGLANMDPDPIGSIFWRNWQILAGLKFSL